MWVVGSPAPAAAELGRSASRGCALRSDVRSLLKLVGFSALVAVLVLGILVASALGALPREDAVVIALIGMVFGGILIGTRLSRGLMTRDEKTD